MDNERTVYSIFAAAYLLMRRVRLVGVNPGRKVGLRFSDVNGEATDALRQWYDPRLMVPATQFVSAYQTARGLVMSVKETD